MRLRHVGVLSFAKVQGALGFVLGLLCAAVYGGSWLVIGGVLDQVFPGSGMFETCTQAGGEGALTMALVLPAGMGIYMFVTGLISACAINWALWLSNGLELDLTQ